MKTSLDHLPHQKRYELAIIRDAIIELGKPVMVILFGSYSRGDWVEDRYREDWITYEYKSDYDILVVTARESDTQIGNSKRIKKKVRKQETIQTPVSLIFHSIEYLNQELEEGSYFFRDVVKEGTLLFDNEQFKLAEAKPLSVKERTLKAKRYFDVWFKEASDFLTMYQLGKDAGLLNQAIFVLHQTAERFYHTLLLVITDYRPKLHDIEELGRQAIIINEHFKLVFPRETDEEKRLFLLLKHAYIDARYKMGYSAAVKDLEYLSERVLKLRDLVEEVCRKRIED